MTLYENGAPNVNGQFLSNNGHTNGEFSDQHKEPLIFFVNGKKVSKKLYKLAKKRTETFNLIKKMFFCRSSNTIPIQNVLC